MLKNLIIPLAAAHTAVTAAAQAPADWANFGRFEKENAALAEHPKVVLMGNSITEGWIAKRPDFFTENGYASRAISGQTTSQMLVRFRADVVELHPQVAVICERPGAKHGLHLARAHSGQHPVDGRAGARQRHPARPLLGAPGR